MKNVFRISGVLLFIFVIPSCKKDKPTPPVIITTEATSVANTTATLNGTVKANNLSTTVSFEYGLTTSYGQTSTAVQSPVSGTNLTNISSGITGLLSGQTYQFRVKAVNAGGTAYGGNILFTTTVIDNDGNVYNTVTIGTQVWMKENLKTTKYSDGQAIPLVADNPAWQALITAGYCYYNNDAVANKATYGSLYNWYSVNSGKLCPTGWHVATNAEWTALTTFLGGESVAGGKLKETGTTHWLSPNTGATNETGFTALPGGGRSSPGEYYGVGNFCAWWCYSTEDLTTNTQGGRLVETDDGKVFRVGFFRQWGNYVRCLRDNV